jgi:PAS domain S-box-containing protein/diguanylate cyclase (GGDEF)-like protein
MVNEKGQETNVAKNHPWNVLLVEDSADDAELCLRALRKAQPEVRCDVVKTPEEFSDRLHANTYDVVLADYTLGMWTGVDALNIMRNKGQEIPFILVTGAIGEQEAVECIKRGMADYILKDRLERLPVAILRALEQKSLRDERQRAEQSLRESEEQFRTLAEAIPAATFVEQETHCRYVNSAAERITGYSREELLAMNFWELVHPDSKKIVIDQATMRLNNEESASRYEIRIITKASEVRWLDVTVGTLRRDGRLAALITAFDITEQRHAAGKDSHLLISDPLTGLPNYRRLLDVFDAEVKRSESTGQPFAVLLLSLDGLEQINDECRNSTESLALRRFAQILLLCRAVDTPARVGEDKFALILPSTRAEGALVLGRKIADRFSNEIKQPALSCSFTAVVFPQDGETIDLLLGIADGRLRETKVGVGGNSRYQR